MEVRSVEAIVRALNAAEVEYLIVDGVRSTPMALFVLLVTLI